MADDQPAYSAGHGVGTLDFFGAGRVLVMGDSITEGYFGPPQRRVDSARYRRIVRALDRRIRRENRRETRRHDSR